MLLWEDFGISVLSGLRAVSIVSGAINMYVPVVSYENYTLTLPSALTLYTAVFPIKVFYLITYIWQLMHLLNDVVDIKYLII